MFKTLNMNQKLIKIMYEYLSNKNICGNIRDNHTT